MVNREDDKLFDKFARADPRPAHYTEDSFSFLNRVNGAFWERLREELEDWFKEYPEPDSSDLRARFRSPKKDQHWAAWWELYLFRLFSRLGYEIDVHPTVDGTKGTPDFVMRKSERSFYVEGLTVFSGVVEEGRDEIREAWVLDIVNEVKSSLFSVFIEFQEVGAERPPTRPIVRQVEEWLERLDPDEVAGIIEGGNEPPALLVEVRDWAFTLEAFPVRPGYRHEPPDRLIGAGPISGGLVDDTDRLRAALRRKSARYRVLGEPLVFAVLSVSGFAGATDFEQALGGQRAVQYRQDGTRQARMIRLKDGLWISAEGPRARHVSAALTASHISPSRFTGQLPRLWLNPWAENCFREKLPFPIAQISQDGSVEYTDVTTDAAEIFGLPANWPGVQPWEEE